MKNEEKRKGKDLLFGTVVGGTVGSVIAFLGITKSGGKLREDVKTKTKKIIVNTEKYIAYTKKKTNKIIGSFKSKAEYLLNIVRKNEDSLLDHSGNILSEKDKAGNYIQDGTSEIHNVVKKNDDSLLSQSGKILNDTKNKAELYVETGTPEIRNEEGN